MVPRQRRATTELQTLVEEAHFAGENQLIN